MHTTTPPYPSMATEQGPVISFAGFQCRLHHGHYAIGGTTALQLLDVTDDELVTTATINIPGLRLDADEVVLKTWDENAGLLELLTAAGVVHPPHEHYPVGVHVASIVRLVTTPR